MSRRMWILTAAALAPVAAVSCASMQKMAPQEAIDTRQKLMKGQGEAWKAIQEKTKAGDVAAVVPQAEKLVQSSKEIPKLFPEGSLTAKSKAKPDIWHKWPEFQAAAKNLETQSEKLRDAAKAKNEQATQDIVKDFGRNACGTCHTPFRVPPARS